jgi:hypothetical protein
MQKPGGIYYKKRKTLKDLSCFFSSPKCGKQFVVVGDFNARTAYLI